MTTPVAPAAAPTPTAPLAVESAPASPLSIFMRCTENRVEDDYDGGLVLFQIIKGQTDAVLADGRLVLSALHDSFMQQFPTTRDAKQTRFFKVTLEEVPFSEVPPDPSAPKVLTALDLTVQARDAAVAAGDTQLAGTLNAALAVGVAAP